MTTDLQRYLHAPECGAPAWDKSDRTSGFPNGARHLRRSFASHRRGVEKLQFRGLHGLLSSTPNRRYLRGTASRGNPRNDASAVRRGLRVPAQTRGHRIGAPDRFSELRKRNHHSFDTRNAHLGGNTTAARCLPLLFRHHPDRWDLENCILPLRGRRHTRIQQNSERQRPLARSPHELFTHRKTL